MGALDPNTIFRERPHKCRRGNRGGGSTNQRQERDYQWPALSATRKARATGGGCSTAHQTAPAAPSRASAPKTKHKHGRIKTPSLCDMAPGRQKMSGVAPCMILGLRGWRRRRTSSRRRIEPLSRPGVCMWIRTGVGGRLAGLNALTCKLGWPILALVRRR